jgi:hypothetical protein
MIMKALRGAGGQWGYGVYIFEELGMASRFLVGEAENTIRQR